MRVLFFLTALLSVGCISDTGSGLVTFEALAGGSKRAQAGAPYEFDNALGYHVSLRHAQLTIGGVYLNRARPILGAQDTACILPGLYAAEVRSSVTLNALSPELVAFEGTGQGTADRALTGELWFTGGEIDADVDNTRVLEFAGTASRQGAVFGFHGAITISRNRAIGSTDPATPGANPLCKQRIVTPIPVNLTPSSDGRLELRVLPEIWFGQVDFAKLPGAVGIGEDLEIPDTRDDSVSATLFQGLRSTNAYSFEWED